MMIVAMAFAILSALLHVFIFYMESISWTSERTRATFNMSAEAAENTKEMAFNQGFYNLFLALEVFVGVLVYVHVPGRWPRPHALWDRLDARRSTAPLHHLAG